MPTITNDKPWPAPFPPERIRWVMWRSPRGGLYSRVYIASDEQMKREKDTFKEGDAA